MRRAIFVLFPCAVSVLRASPIVLDPGSLLLSQSTSAITVANTISYTKSGAIVGTGQITGTNDLAEAMTALNGNLYVSDGAGDVNRINLSSGAVASSFGTGTIGLDGLGSVGSNLIAVGFSSTAIRVYSPSGLLMNSITLSSLPTGFDWIGLASDGTTFYIGDYGSGRIYKYNGAGASLGFINTGLANALLNFSYDASNNSLWVTSGTQVLDYSLTGTVLSQFSTASFRGSAIAVVPNSTVPETSYPVVIAIAFTVVVLRAACVRLNVYRSPTPTAQARAAQETYPI